MGCVLSGRSGESFDDWIFYIKSRELRPGCVAALPFSNGGCGSFFRGRGLIQGIHDGDHAYYNILVGSKEWWFTLEAADRREQVGSLLQDAIQSRSQRNADVYRPINHQAMTAKLTWCRHMSQQLSQKVAHKQDSCPMCLELLHKVTPPPRPRMSYSPRGDRSHISRSHDDGRAV